MKIAILLSLCLTAAGPIRAQEFPFDVKADIRRQLGEIVQGMGAARKAAAQRGQVKLIVGRDPSQTGYLGAPARPLLETLLAAEKLSELAFELEARFGDAEAVSSLRSRLTKIDFDAAMKAIDDETARIQTMPVEFAGALALTAVPGLPQGSTSGDAIAALLEKAERLDGPLVEALADEYRFGPMETVIAPPPLLYGALRQAAQARFRALKTEEEEAKTLASFLAKNSALGSFAAIDARRAVLTARKDYLLELRTVRDLQVQGAQP